jgi:hypothetical protein
MVASLTVCCGRTVNRGHGVSKVGGGEGWGGRLRYPSRQVVEPPDPKLLFSLADLRKDERTSERAIREGERAICSSIVEGLRVEGEQQGIRAKNRQIELRAAPLWLVGLRKDGRDSWRANLRKNG